MTQQLQQMELATSPTTTGDETMATQADMLNQGTYVCIILHLLGLKRIYRIFIFEFNSEFVRKLIDIPNIRNP